MRRSWPILALTVLAAIAVACGTSSGSDPTETGLRSRAESQAKAQSAGKWAEWYKFFSAGNRSACSEAEFSAAADLSMSMFRESRELDESDQLEFRVQEVTVSGAQGIVVFDIYLDEELFFDAPSENWVFADGDWWSVNSGGPGCWSTAAPAVVPSAFEAAITPTSGADAFDESNMRALLSGEEVEAAIPLIIGNRPLIRDLRGLAGDEGMVGMDSIWGHLFHSAAGGQLMVIVTDFVSPAILQEQIVLWTVRDSLRFTESAIGDGSLHGEEGGTVSVRFWKGDKAVLLTATGLPKTQEVLDGLIALAELASSRLSLD